jgi:hypothetical protein
MGLQRATIGQRYPRVQAMLATIGRNKPCFALCWYNAGVMCPAFPWMVVEPDLDLGHGFHQTRQGTRFTISEAARQEAMGRLLALNHEHYRREEKLGLHDKGGKGKKARAASPAEATVRAPGLFEAE